MYKFDPKGDPPESAFRAIALDQLGEALAELDRPDDEGRSVVHEVRRRCKKLRGLLRLVRPAFPGYAAENAAIRDAARLLSHVRDAEVLTETVADLAKWRPDDALTRIHGRLAAVPAGVDPATRLAEFRDRLSAIRDRAEHWSLNRAGWDALQPGLCKTYRAERRAMDAARDTGRAADFHEWRKLNKYHGFHLDLLRRAAPDVLHGEVDVVDRLSLLLGTHHDLDVLRAAVANDPDRFGDPADLSTLQTAIGARLKDIEHQSLELGRQLLAEKPRAHARRFAAYWKSAA